MITNTVLADALEKPEEVEEPPRKEDPRILRKGRCAYKLPVYQQKTAVKVKKLEDRMRAIGNKQDDEWKKLRK